jgi:hypothetical protein
MNPLPFAPPAWQHPHLLSLKPGERGLVVIPFSLLGPKDKPHELSYIDNRVYSRISRFKAEALDVHHISRPADEGYVWCPMVKGGGKGDRIECLLGPVGSVLACKEALRGDGQPGNRRVGIARYALDGEMVLADGQDWLWDFETPQIPAEEMPVEWARLFLRTTAVDLRRTDSMTEEEAVAWGVSRQWSKSHRVTVAKNCWDQDHPSHPWGAWAWFVGVEKLNQGE